MSEDAAKLAPKPAPKLAVVAAGGTGGHLFPAEALARELIGRGWRIVLATDARGAEHAEDFPAEERLALDAATLRLRDPFGVARGLARIAAGVGQARAALRRLRPAVVVGFGGYPSLPAMAAARMTVAPSVIHEQNAVMGRANRLLSPHATAIATAFPTLLKASRATQARAVVVGNPVRPAIRALYDRPYAPPGDLVQLLMTGGSQGSRLLSETVPLAVARLPDALRARLRVEQQTRQERLDAARDVYARAGVRAEVQPFFRDMAERLARAHLVVGRSGASSVCEFAIAGRPSILAPLGSALDDDQGQNARLLAEAGGAVVIAERELTPDRLAQTLAELLTDPARLIGMSSAARAIARPDAAERLADLVERTAR